MKKQTKLSNLISGLDINYDGEDVVVDGLGLCNRQTNYKYILSYVTTEDYVDYVRNNKNIVCLVLNSALRNNYSKDAIGREISYIYSDNPEICFYNIHERACESGLLYEEHSFEPKIGLGCNIDNSVVIEKGVIIGNKVTIGANTVVRQGTIIEDDVTIGCNSTIGSEGFQLITSGEESPMHITHVGKCHISSKVYIGDNTCICNSLFGGETFIGEGAKIDNLVHVAHNLYIGEGAVVTAHVILCGSSRVEDHAWIGPNSSVLNRVTIGKFAKVGLGSVVTRDVEPYTTVYGSPAKVHLKQ